ncbi:MAG: NAD(P)/FAD-dependent oxidoreductase [Ilumatobacteraceae bacterium]
MERRRRRPPRGDAARGRRVAEHRDRQTSTLPVTGLFVAIGHRPNTDLFKGVLDMEDSGYLITRPGSSYTNVDGVFACGDVQDHVPAGDHGRRLGLHGGDRHRTVARGQRPLTRDARTSSTSPPRRRRTEPPPACYHFVSNRRRRRSGTTARLTTRLRCPPERIRPWPMASSPSPRPRSTRPSRRATSRSSSTSGPSGVARAR